MCSSSIFLRNGGYTICPSLWGSGVYLFKYVSELFITKLCLFCYCRESYEFSNIYHFIAMTCHSKSTKSNHPHFFHIPFVRRKFHSNNFQLQENCYSVEEIPILLWTPQSTMSGSGEYLIEGIAVPHELYSGQPLILNDCDQKCVSRIVWSNRQVTPIQITSTFTEKLTGYISSWSIQHFLASVEYGIRTTTKLPLLMPGHSASSCDIANSILEDWQHVV